VRAGTTRAAFLGAAFLAATGLTTTTTTTASSQALRRTPDFKHTEPATGLSLRQRAYSKRVRMRDSGSGWRRRRSRRSRRRRSAA
jgi:hypothetical protein